MYNLSAPNKLFHHTCIIYPIETFMISSRLETKARRTQEWDREVQFQWIFNEHSIIIYTKKLVSPMEWNSLNILQVSTKKQWRYYNDSPVTILLNNNKYNNYYIIIMYNSYDKWEHDSSMETGQ